jgi:hypothetical protein
MTSYSLLLYVLAPLAIMLGSRATTQTACAQDIKQTPLYGRIKAALDAVPAIDTHDHLRPFAEIPGRHHTPDGTGITLWSIWSTSYFPGLHTLTPWAEGMTFEQWWDKAQHDFDHARATSFYRYLLPAFRDLYGVDFDTITPEQARRLNDQIFANYQDDAWLLKVVAERANIELMLIDPYWARLKFERAWPFAVQVLNVNTLIQASHPDRFLNPLDSPYVWARRAGLPTASFEDYLALVENIFQQAVEADAVCLKTTLAYERTLEFRRVPREQAAAAYGTPPAEISPESQRNFEDFMVWHIAGLSAKYELPFQIHTGHGRVQGSNPLLLADLIQANPNTRFVLFHGGFPWIGETGILAMRHRNVYIDSCWLPTLSYATARRAYQEWLDCVPSNRIMWGADTVQAEGIYAATEFTRQCLAEALAEKVARHELREEHALRIGRQILRENALELFPKLRRMLWRKPSTKDG